MIKVLVSGAKGRMGQRIAYLISEMDGIRVAAGVDKDDSFEDVIEKADVAIEFSAPDASAQHTRICAEHKKPIVIGTTGLGDSHEKVLQDLSPIIPIVYAPNMSMGVNVMWQLIEVATKALKDEFAIDIEETHHVHKLDKPSGTAKRMLDIVLKQIEKNPRTNVSHYEEAMPGRKKGDESIRVCSIREGEAVGDHEIRFRSDEDTLTIRHHAKTRDVFAKGAIAAARWIVGKPAGLYDMMDVLNLRDQ